MSKYSKLSKQVGWKLDMITEFPTLEQIESADDKQILTWHRFLRGPKNEAEAEIITAITSKIFKIRVHSIEEIKVINKETTNGCDMQ